MSDNEAAVSLFTPRSSACGAIPGGMSIIHLIRKQSMQSLDLDIHFETLEMYETPRPGEDYDAETVPVTTARSCAGMSIRTGCAILLLLLTIHIAALLSVGLRRDQFDRTGFPVYVIRTSHLAAQPVVVHIAHFDCLVLLVVLGASYITWFLALSVAPPLLKRYEASLTHGGIMHRFFIDSVCAPLLTLTLLLISGVGVLEILVLNCIVVFTATVLVVYRYDPVAQPGYPPPTLRTVAVVAGIHLVPVVTAIVAAAEDVPWAYPRVGIICIRAAYITWMCSVMYRGKKAPMWIRRLDTWLHPAHAMAISWVVYMLHYAV